MSAKKKNKQKITIRKKVPTRKPLHNKKRIKRKLLPPAYSTFLALRQQAEESSKEFRFGRTVVPISRIAKQFYCEKSLEFSELETALLTPDAIELSENHKLSMQKGDEGHTSDLPFVLKKSEKDIWIGAFQENRRTPISVHEFYGIFQIDGVFVNGSIDSVVFLKGKALSISEYKFRSFLRLYDTDRIQANLYGLLLYNLGFDTSDLLIRAACFHPDDRLEALVMNKLFPGEIRMVQEDYKFDFSEAMKNIAWALQFWKSEREAIFTSHMGKCNKCEYFENCRNIKKRKNTNPLQMELPL